MRNSIFSQEMHKICMHIAENMQSTIKEIKYVNLRIVDRCFLQCVIK